MCAAFLPLALSLSSQSLRNFTQGPVNVYNCPVVTVSESTFENNHAQSVFTDLPSRVSGGGLSVTIHDRSNSSVVHSQFSYTIQNCTFSNNSANSTVPAAGTTSILNGHVNGRGGGVAFYVVHHLVIEIKVLGCNFTNNSASFTGGGLYVFSPEVDTEMDFTIAMNRFEGNTAKNGGGGVALAGGLQQKIAKEYLNKTALKESVVFSKNMFVQNKGTRGGALYLGLGGWVVGYNTHCLYIIIILPARRISQHNMIYDFGGSRVYDAMCVHQRGGGVRIH